MGGDGWEMLVRRDAMASDQRGASMSAAAVAAGSTEQPADGQAEVFAYLASPATHGGAETTRIDTHGAVVILAGPDVYKVKRAVRFAFMDLSTLDRRRRACEREVAVNAGFAPSLDYRLVAVTRRPDGSLCLGGEGEVVEWVVRMRRFDETLTFDRIAGRGELDFGLLQRAAAAIAGSHARAPVRRDADFAGSLREIVAENTATLLEVGGCLGRQRITRLGDATNRALDAVEDILRRRAADGHVRRCHADLHLRNIALIDGEPTLFDALEFDEDLATIDVLYDLAFLVMDLLQRRMRDEANRVFNRYLTETRDEAGLPGVAAMPLFIAVRATIRAKVEAVRLGQGGDAASKAAAEDYLALAERALRAVPPRLVAIGGLSGSGKSTVAGRIAPRVGALPGAVHLRSDVERKSLMGAPEFEKLPPAAYDRETTEAVYGILVRKAETVLRAGLSVVVDAVYQREDERRALATLAERQGCHFDGLWLDAPPATMADRVSARRGDASDADARIVAEQSARDCGRIDWHRVDAGGNVEQVVADAAAVVSAEAASDDKDDPETPDRR